MFIRSNVSLEKYGRSFHYPYFLLCIQVYNDYALPQVQSCTQYINFAFSKDVMKLPRLMSNFLGLETSQESTDMSLKKV